MRTVFHTMEKFSLIFPHYGKSGSCRATVWKTPPRAPSCVPVFPGFLLKALPVFFLLLTGCAPAPRDAALHGRTMGTTYSIRLAQVRLDRGQLNDLQTEVDALLDKVNQEMSLWRPESEISRFNRSSTGEPFSISPGFAQVVRRSLAIAEATDGTFDPTVGALVDLWGFGPDGLPTAAPEPEQIAPARETVGWRHLALTDDFRLSKDIPGLQLDLGAVAKGDGVDRTAVLLRERGLTNFVVEIGGETRADGLNPDGVPWRIGVLRPDDSGELHGVVSLTGGGAIATSGDYRNFYRDETGAFRSHVIDPRTAAPVGHSVASVSVRAPDCLTADALATALLVLGPDEGLPLLASAFPGVEALFLVRAPDGSFAETATPGWPDGANQ